MNQKRHPNVDPALCNGCGLCLEVCCKKVYDMISGKAQAARPGDCCGSGHDLCAGKCPAGAISFEGEPSSDGSCACDCGSGSGCCGES